MGFCVALTGTGNTADCLGLDTLPGLNATSINIRQECSAWQRGKVDGPQFVATLKAYIDTTGPFECNLKLFLCFSLSLSLALKLFLQWISPLTSHQGRFKQKWAIPSIPGVISFWGFWSGCGRRSIACLSRFKNTWQGQPCLWVLSVMVGVFAIESWLGQDSLSLLRTPPKQPTHLILMEL